MALNKVMLIGNAGRDPEVRYIENAPAQQPDMRPKVALFTLATSERYRGKDGSVQEQTEWHNIVAWRQLADLSEKYIRKGTQVYIEGRLRTRSWDSNGKTMYRTEIIADRMQLLGSRPEGQARTAARPQTSPEPPAAEAQGRPYGDMTSKPPVYGEPEDDLPF